MSIPPIPQKTSRASRFAGIATAPLPDYSDPKVADYVVRNELLARAYAAGTLLMMKERPAPVRQSTPRPQARRAPRRAAKKTATGKISSTEDGPPPAVEETPLPRTARLVRDPGQSRIDFVASVLLGALARADGGVA